MGDRDLSMRDMVNGGYPESFPTAKSIPTLIPSSLSPKRELLIALESS